MYKNNANSMLLWYEDLFRRQRIIQLNPMGSIFHKETYYAIVQSNLKSGYYKEIVKQNIIYWNQILIFTQQFSCIYKDIAIILLICYFRIFSVI